MKRLLFVVLAALSLSGCSTVTGSFLQRGPKRPSEETVRAYIRQGDEAGARAFLLKWRPSLPDADMDEYIIRAIQDVDEERAKCAGLGKCAVAAAPAAKE